MFVPAHRYGQEFAAARFNGAVGGLFRRSVLDAPLAILPIAINDFRMILAIRPSSRLFLTLGRSFVRSVSLILLFLAQLCGADAGLIVGEWSLVSWNSSPIADQHIAELVLTFTADGKLSSRVQMDEKWHGLVAEGSGSWSLASDGSLTWTHGQNTGKALLKITDMSLEMSEDILVRANGGKVPGPSAYKRK